MNQQIKQSLNKLKGKQIKTKEQIKRTPNHGALRKKLSSKIKSFKKYDYQKNGCQKFLKNNNPKCNKLRTTKTRRANSKSNNRVLRE